MDIVSFETPQRKVKIFYCDEITLPPVNGTNAIYIADTNTVSLLHKAKNYLPALPLAVIESGEEHKTFASIEKILETALSAGLDRNAVFIGVGGGVICDMTGFASSVYMRGASHKLVPTSLLAMADAAVGGKTGINFKTYKNLIGTFFTASEIYIAPKALQTLNQKEYLGGLAEIFKMSLLYSQELFEIFKTERKRLLSATDNLIPEIIKLSVNAKVKIITEDFSESSSRAILNFGHTFAHALETWADFLEINHGCAVAWGIGRALLLGVQLKKTDEKYAESVLQILSDYGWDSHAIPSAAKKIMKEKNIPPEAFEKEFADKLIKIMLKDKKNRSGKIRFVLQENICENFLQEVDAYYIKKVLI